MTFATPVSVSLPAEDLAQIEFLALDHNANRVKIIRAIVSHALETGDLDYLAAKLNDRADFGQQLCDAGLHAWHARIRVVDDRIDGWDRECARCDHREPSPR